MNPKRALALLATPVLALSCLGVAACGSKPAAQPETTAATTTAETPAADPTQKFIGTFKMAALESGDVTITGSFKAVFENADATTLDIKSDGTGTMTLGSNTASFDWKLKDDNDIDVTFKNSDSVKANTIAYKDGALQLSADVEGEKMTMTFTPDGTYAKAKDISMDKGTPITSESQLLGTWKVSGMAMSGMSAYGSPEGLLKLGASDIGDVVFEPGGVVKMGDETDSYKIDANGATITGKGFGSEVTIPIKMLDNELMIDLTSVLQGYDIVMLLAKQ